MSAGLISFSCPMVDEAASDCVAEQKLPKPWVGKIWAASGSSAASRRAEAHCARASAAVASGPSRSVRPVEPYSSDPPVNTPATPPPGAASAASTT